jgi:hypothetical protein
MLASALLTARSPAASPTTCVRHHFAYMAISIALLGYGASGSFLALFQDRLRPRFTAVYALSAALFGSSAVAAFALAQRLP